MYGGRGGEETRPEFVLTDWHVASEFMKDFNGFVSICDCLCLPALLLGCGDADHLLLGLCRAAFSMHTQLVGQDC